MFTSSSFGPFGAKVSGQHSKNKQALSLMAPQCMTFDGWTHSDLTPDGQVFYWL